MTDASDYLGGAARNLAVAQFMLGNLNEARVLVDLALGRDDEPALFCCAPGMTASNSARRQPPRRLSLSAIGWNQAADDSAAATSAVKGSSRCSGSVGESMNCGTTDR